MDEGDTVTLSGSGTDPEGASLAYAWIAPAGIAWTCLLPDSVDNDRFYNYLKNGPYSYCPKYRPRRTPR